MFTIRALGLECTFHTLVSSWTSLKIVTLDLGPGISLQSIEPIKYHMLFRVFNFLVAAFLAHAYVSWDSLGPLLIHPEILSCFGSWGSKAVVCNAWGRYVVMIEIFGNFGESVFSLASYVLKDKSWRRVTLGWLLWAPKEFWPVPQGIWVVDYAQLLTPCVTLDRQFHLPHPLSFLKPLPAQTL